MPLELLPLMDGLDPAYNSVLFVPEPAVHSRLSLVWAMPVRP